METATQPKPKARRRGPVNPDKDPQLALDRDTFGRLKDAVHRGGYSIKGLATRLINEGLANMESPPAA